MNVELHDLYQLLIAECRYGYTRNNHLMPSSAYSHVKKYLDLMFKEDSDFAIHTALQICEECISDQLLYNFADALEDEHGNRLDAINFVEYLVKWLKEHNSSAMPYNYQIYTALLKYSKELKYRVFELDDFDIRANRIRELTIDAVSKDEADLLLFAGELKASGAEFNRINIKTETYPVRVVGEVFRIIKPEAYKNKIYSIELWKRF